MATSVLKDVLAAFSPRGDYFVITTGDGRVKTWDVASGHVSGEFTEITSDGPSALTGSASGHLAIEYTTLAWGAVPSGTAKKSKKKGSLLTLGTGGGDVLAWDPALGELKWRTTDCNSGGVKSVCFVKGRQLLYSAGADGTVRELDSVSGEVLDTFRAAKSAVASIAVSPDGERLLAAGSEMKLFDLSSKKRIRKFTGHASSVRALTFTGDGKYALSAAVGDRHVAVWDCDGSDRGAAMVLSMEHPAVALDSCGFEKEGKPCKVLAVSEAGEAYIWSGMSLEDLAKASPTRISVAASNPANARKSSRQCIILARLIGPESVLVAQGTTVKPSFETVSLEERTGNIVLGASQHGGLLGSQPDNSISRSSALGVTVLGPDNAADAGIIKSRVESKNVNKKKRRASHEPDEILEEPKSESKGTEGADVDGVAPMAEDNDEQTMEERLMALGLVDDARSVGNALDNAEVVPPRADSLDVLLTQALRSDDNDLLEQCFSVSNEKVVANTIRTLNPLDASKLLKVAISKLESRPRRGLQLTPWIRTVLLEHATFLMTNPTMQPVLTALYQIIDARLYVFRPLLSLSGRLDLILAQIKANEAYMKETGEAEAAVVYEEEDSDQDVEDAMEDEEEDESGEEDAMQEDKPQENGGSLSDDGSEQSED